MGRRLSLRSTTSSVGTTATTAGGGGESLLLVPFGIFNNSNTDLSSSSDSDSEDPQSKSPILKRRLVPSADPTFFLFRGDARTIATTTTTTLGSLLVPWIATALAALLLHATGLIYGVWPYYNGTVTELVLAVTGSVCEGVWLLLVLHRLALATIHVPWQWWWQERRRQTQQSNNKNNSNNNNRWYRSSSHSNSSSIAPPSSLLWLRSSWTCLCGTCRTVAPALTFVTLSFIILTSILGDVYYRAESGGLAPEIWVLAAFYLNAAEYVRAKWVAAATPDESTTATTTTTADDDSNNGDSAGDSTAGASKTSVQVSEDFMNSCMILCFIGAIVLFLAGQFYQWQRLRHVQSNESSCTARHCHCLGCCGKVDSRNNKLLLLVTAVTLFAYSQLDAWSPVMHALLCFGGRWFFAPGQQYSFDVVKEPVTTPDSTQAPNVIYLVHESLSGSILEKTEGGKTATPFFHSLMENDDFYLFPHARSVSGDTRDCTTALLTGCLPIDEKGRQRAYGRSMGTEFKRRGYATMSVTSYPMNFDQTAWFMMQNYMGGNMDVVVDPLSTGLEKINIEGCDDHALLPYFDKWVKQDVKEQGRPFYGQIYTFNQHYPYLVSPNSTATTRYYSSLESFDSLLKHLFDLLEETGQLDNTIIVGSGDHGEHPDLQDYIRLKRFNSDVISTATYMWAPKHLFPSEEDRERLRHNTQQTVSTLDLFPTIQHFLYGGSVEETANLRAEHRAADTTSANDRDHCVSGVDLLSTTVPDDRLSVQWNKISQPLSGYKGNFLGALSGKETGIYVKGSGTARSRSFKAWELDFGECTASWEADCAIELTEERRRYWLQRIAQPQPSSMVNDQVYQTRYMHLLREVLEASQPVLNTNALIL